MLVSSSKWNSLVMHYIDDHISFFVSFINIPVSLDNLFQFIGSVYYCP